MSFDNIVITSIKESATNVFHKGGPYNTKNRGIYALLFCQSGQTTYIMNGKKFVCDPSHALLLPKGSNYTFYINEEGVFTSINFDCSNLSCEEITVFDIDDQSSFIEDCKKMHSLFLFPENRLMIYSIFYRMFDRLIKEPLPSKNILHPAIIYMEKNIFSPELSNSILAKKANISEVYFRKLFIEKYGTTPKQYILDVRIHKAKQLLKSSNLTVTEISDACGFSSLFSFSRAFKDKTGLTPTGYSRKKSSTVF